MNNKTYRQYFGNFKRTLEYKELQSKLYKKQLGLCVNCKTSISLNQNTHCDHIIPIKELECLHRLDLVYNVNNFNLLCNKCNLKKSSKYNKSEIEDLLLLFNISDE